MLLLQAQRLKSHAVCSGCQPAMHEPSQTVCAPGHSSLCDGLLVSVPGAYAYSLPPKTTSDTVLRRTVPCMQGYGGFMYSDDGGDSWALASDHPFHNTINSVTVDPTDPCKLYYATGGAGVLHGAAPPGLPGC